MSDTMRDAFEAWAKREGLNLARCETECPAGSIPHTDKGMGPSTYYKHEAETAWRAWANKPAQSQPAQPVPSSVQEIMRLMGPYISACVNCGVNNVTGRTSLQFEADAAKIDAAFKPLQAALVALVDDNHRLKFELDGVNAMRRPAMEEHAARWMWARKNLLSACFQSGKHNSGQTSITPIGEANTDWYWDRIADQFRGIEPEQVDKP